eukprot:1989009-Pleurochrysis_carterae.AAC.4
MHARHRKHASVAQRLVRAFYVCSDNSGRTLPKVQALASRVRARFGTGASDEPLISGHLCEGGARHASFAPNAKMCTSCMRAAHPSSRFDAPNIGGWQLVPGDMHRSQWESSREQGKEQHQICTLYLDDVPPAALSRLVIARA